jgi:hypothetical protein
MDQPIKPIKRSKELVPLSKEHHGSLLFGWKIKQGLRNGTDPKIIAQFIEWFWQNELQDHFKKEEQVLAAQIILRKKNRYWLHTYQKTMNWFSKCLMSMKKLRRSLR